MHAPKIFEIRVAPKLRVFSLLLALCLSASAQPRIQVTFEPGTTVQGEAMRQLLQSSPVPVRLAASLSRLLNLPRDLPIVFREAPALNAWYSPNAHSITVSYRLASFLRMKLDDQATRGAMDFILMHELGHALIGELDLPQVGREEDAADEFATVVCAEALGEEGRSVALAGAQAFWTLGEGKYKLEALPFYDEHSLERQRFYTILANLGAADAALRPSLAPVVPYTRLREAQESYPLKVDHWNRLLAASEKTPSQHRIQTVAAGNGKLRLQGIVPLALAQMSGYLERSYRLPRDFTVEQRAARAQFLPLSGYLIFPLGAPPEDFLLAFCHGLIHDLQLPYTGELADAAAELCAVLMVSQSGLRPLTRPTLDHYQELARAHHSVLDVQYWSSTAQPEQRYFELMGYLYCQDPVAYPEAKSKIPADRLKKISHEYPRKLRNWSRLLAPYQR